LAFVPRACLDAASGCAEGVDGRIEGASGAPTTLLAAHVAGADATNANGGRTRSDRRAVFTELARRQGERFRVRQPQLPPSIAVRT
jgi:hypothetical protein